MTTKETIYLLRNTAWLAPSSAPIDEAIDMICEALRKTENCSKKTNNCDTCRFELYCPEMCEGCCEWDSHYEPKDEPQTCSVNGRPYSECADCEYFRCTADEPQTYRYMTAEQTADYRKMLDNAEHKVYGNVFENEPQIIIGERFPSYITENNAQVLDGWQANPRTSTTAVENES